MFKRIFNLIFCVILVVTLVPASISYADQNGGNAGTGSLGLRILEKTGNFHYEALNTKATSGIRYVSVGWIMWRDYSCSDHGGNPQPLSAKCNH